jgi:hypothetical protein
VITLAAFAIALPAMAVCLFTLHQLRAGWKALREREVLADAFDKVLRGREADLRRREKAVWWAERSPQWLPR